MGPLSIDCFNSCAYLKKGYCLIVLIHSLQFSLITIEKIMSNVSNYIYFSGKLRNIRKDFLISNGEFGKNYTTTTVLLLSR